MFGKIKRNKERLDSVALNDAAYNYYTSQLEMIAISLFEWKGLPTTVDTLYLEKALFYKYKVTFFVDDVVGLSALPFISGGGFSVYGYPSERNIYSSYNSYKTKRDKYDSVICYDNVLKTSTMDITAYYANRLWDADRTIDVNISNQKTPSLLVADKSTRQSVLNAYQQRQGNKPAIAVNKKFDPNSIRQFETMPPFVAKDIYDVRTSIWNDAMTALGVPNVNVNKKERLIKDEVQRGSGGSIVSRYPRLAPRQKAAKEISEMFKNYLDEEVTVGYREELLDVFSGDVSRDTLYEIDDNNEGSDAAMGGEE